MDAALMLLCVGIAIGVGIGFSLGYAAGTERCLRRWHKYYKD